MKNIHSMGMQLLRLLMLAGICSISFLAVIYICSSQLINKYFSGSELQLQMTEKRISGFEEYISKNALAATDTEDIIRWCDRQPMVLMEIYRDHILYFNSKYNYEIPLIEQNIETPRYSWYSYYQMQFADGPAEVLVYSDESYILNTWITIGATALSCVLFITIVLVGIRRTIRYIYLLCDEIQIMGSGDLEHPITVRGKNEMSLLAKELDQMRSALCYHRQREQDMIRQSNDMITHLSHDLRTPLTKLMLYTEIIQNGRYLDKMQLDKYLSRIHEKGMQIKEISEHLLKYSLSQAAEEVPAMQISTFHSAFFDRLSELTDYLSEHDFAVECDINWSEVKIRYNDLYLDRIMDNIVSNIDKYAEKTSSVKMRSVHTGNFIGISVKNMLSSAYDSSESNGVGIVNIHTLMHQMNGSCTVEQTKMAFEITLLFPQLVESGGSPH